MSRGNGESTISQLSSSRPTSKYALCHVYRCPVAYTHTAEFNRSLQKHPQINRSLKNGSTRSPELQHLPRRGIQVLPRSHHISRRKLCSGIDILTPLTSNILTHTSRHRQKITSKWPGVYVTSHITKIESKPPSATPFPYPPTPVLARLPEPLPLFSLSAYCSPLHRLILIYLIPCHLITQSHLPSPTLLAAYPTLAALFGPLRISIKSGNLTAFDAALASNEKEFVKRRIYLTLERTRDIALRNLSRKVFLAGGWEEKKEGEEDGNKVRRTRIPVKEFAAAMRIGGGRDGREDLDEVECALGGLIYKVCNLLFFRERGWWLPDIPGSTCCVATRLQEGEANLRIGLHERLHLPRTKYRGLEQGGRLSGYWRVTQRNVVQYSIAQTFATRVTPRPLTFRLSTHVTGYESSHTRTLHRPLRDAEMYPNPIRGLGPNCPRPHLGLEPAPSKRHPTHHRLTLSASHDCLGRNISTSRR
jgi:hypothetical protein